MYNIAIIGSGPAGLSAAINCVARNKSVIVIGNKIETSWLYKAEKVDNYLGMPGMSGKELIESFKNHAELMEVEIRTGKAVQIMSMGKYFTINVNSVFHSPNSSSEKASTNTNDNSSIQDEFINAEAVIITTGSQKGSAVKGESEFLGKGVSYCATCDGMLYRGKGVAVIGEHDEAIEEANFLSEICEKVYYIPKKSGIEGLNKNIEIVDEKLNEIYGNEFVESIKTINKEIKVDGVFLIKESNPPSSLIFGLEIENNYIKTDRNMHTNIKGVFAAGDCTGMPLQVANAVGDGLVAGLEAVSYVSALSNNK